MAQVLVVLEKVNDVDNPIELGQDTFARVQVIPSVLVKITLAASDEYPSGVAMNMPLP